jgi:hypothetical protein
MDKRSQPCGELSHGVTVADLKEAVDRSGYPFQAIVSDILHTVLKVKRFQRTSFQLQEEWAYIDRESGDARSIDIFAEVPLIRENDPRADPRLCLLIECKQSDLPYVFFLRANPPEQIYSFPEITGTGSTEIRFFNQDGGGHYSASHVMSIHDTFDTADVDFLDTPCPFAISIAKAARRSGSKLELTGEDAYKNTILPLTKAADHIRMLTTSEVYRMWRFILCVVVIKAPMYGAYYHHGQRILTPVPWVRACRLEPESPGASAKEWRSNVRYFDVVHESHLPQYLTDALGAMKWLANRMANKAGIVDSGRALFKRTLSYRGMRPIPKDIELPDAKQEETGSWIGRQRPRLTLASLVDDDKELDHSGREG